tara:strand:+ start:408 stop:620 length:213 start_codon:yes stop_codon:yes gene_type:complete
MDISEYIEQTKQLSNLSAEFPMYVATWLSSREPEKFNELHHAFKQIEPQIYEHGVQETWASENPFTQNST